MLRLTLPRASLFNDQERDTIIEALKNFRGVVADFCSDSAHGDDIDSMRRHLALVDAMIAEWRGDVNISIKEALK